MSLQQALGAELQILRDLEVDARPATDLAAVVDLMDRWINVNQMGSQIKAEMEYSFLADSYKRWEGHIGRMRAMSSISCRN
jgi:hypothetical protein